MAKITFRKVRRRNTKGKVKHRTRVNWELVDVERFKTRLEPMLRDAQVELDLSLKCQQIEQILTTAAEEASSFQAQIKDKTRSSKLDDLVEARRNLSNSQSCERKVLSNKNLERNPGVEKT